MTKKIGIVPTRTREKKDWPVPSVAKTLWQIGTEKEECKVVSLQFEKMIVQLYGKEDVIMEICREYGIEASFTVVIEMENGDGPEMVLTKDIISFVSSINAEIGFDIYVE